MKVYRAIIKLGNISNEKEWRIKKEEAIKDALEYWKDDMFLYYYESGKINKSILDTYIETIDISKAVHLAEERASKNYELMKTKDEFEFDSYIIDSWKNLTEIRKNIIADFIN